MLSPDHIGSERRQAIVMALCPAIIDPQILSLCIAHFFQTTAEARNEMRQRHGGGDVQKPDHRRRGLLRARRERPRSGAAECRDKVSPSHCLAPVQ